VPARRQHARRAPESPKSLTGKVAVVTGASRGIGAAIAEALSEEGCRLALMSRSIGKHASDDRLVQPCDVRDEKSVQQFFAAVKRRFGEVHILVNNAGVAGPLRNIEKMSLQDWKEALDTNLTGTFLCTRTALPLMKRGATIVNNLSVAAKGTFPGMAAYVAAKHGAMGFTMTLREELRERGIRVVALMPGATDTELWQQFWPEAPHQRMMSAETVARAVVNLLTLPENATVEELVLAPTGGAL
jgi:NAD(P)-dependent dehydrogenase (short-subunit alcohol dehydrogenase family)